MEYLRPNPTQPPPENPPRRSLLEGVATLQLEGLFPRNATAETGNEYWHFARRGLWQRVTQATDALGTVVGEFETCAEAEDSAGAPLRITQSLVLLRESLLSPEFASIEEYLGEHTADYYNALQQ